MPRSASIAALPSATARPSTVPVTPLPVTASKSRASAQRQAARLGAAHDRLGQRMLGPALERGGEPQHLRLVVPGLGQHRDELGLADGQRAGLVDDQRVDRGEGLERLGVPDQHARLRAAAGRGHDRHRRREPERAGAGDDQHRDRRDQRVGERRRRPPDRPGDEGEHRDADHRRHEPAGDRVGELLDRRARALRRGHHLDDLREHGVLADAPRLDDEAAGAVDASRRSPGRRRPSRPAPARRSASTRRPRSGPRPPRRRPAPSRPAAPAAGRRPRPRRAAPPPRARPRGSPARSSRRGRAAPGSPSRCARGRRARGSGRAAPAPR